MLELLEASGRLVLAVEDDPTFAKVLCELATDLGFDCETAATGEEALQMAREIMAKSPTAIRMLKFAFNLTDDGLMGQQVFAGEATRLAYMTDEAVEGKQSFLDKREPNWDEFPYYY